MDSKLANKIKYSNVLDRVTLLILSRLQRINSVMCFHQELISIMTIPLVVISKTKQTRKKKRVHITFYTTSPPLPPLQWDITLRWPPWFTWYIDILSHSIIHSLNRIFQLSTPPPPNPPPYPTPNHLSLSLKTGGEGGEKQKSREGNNREKRKVNTTGMPTFLLNRWIHTSFSVPP